MQSKRLLLALTAACALTLTGVIAASSSALAMGPVSPSAVSKTDATAVEPVHRKWRKRYYRRHAYYPRYYRRHYNPYYYSYSPYYYSPYYYRPYYGAYYGPRFYGGGIRIYGRGFGVRVGW